MASEVDICNLALNEIGESQIIDLTEASKAARLCNLVYSDTRDAVLREHPWNFAIKRAELARLTTDPIFDFDAQFQLPSDCLRVIRTDDDLDPYRIEGERLLSVNDSVKIEYISRVEDTTKFDPLFVETLSVRIGAKLAYNLSDNNTLTQLLEQKYRDRVKQARSMDGQEGIPRSTDADLWINSRV
jgi:hypothetical protein